MKVRYEMFDYKCTHCKNKIPDHLMYIEDEAMGKIKPTAMLPVYWKAVDKKVAAVFCTPECATDYGEKN
jgi:hypothetical protein